MKKIIALLLALVMVFALVACNKPAENKPEEPKVDFTKSEGVMTYAEYAAAALDTEVTVECFVQGHQSWWDNKITVYAQDNEGGYLMYNMACAEADASKLVPGTKIKVKGYKAEWEGEVEIVDATFEIMEGSYVAEAIDVTNLLGTEDLIKKQNMFVSFKDLSFVKFDYQGGERGKDLYVTLSYNGADYDFCVESYLTGPDSDVYKAVEGLKAGDKVDVEGFLYWYQGENTHITKIVKK